MRSARLQSPAPEITFRLSLPLFVPELFNRVKNVSEAFTVSTRNLSSSLTSFKPKISLSSDSLKNFSKKVFSGGKNRLPIFILILVLVGVLAVSVRAFRAATANSSDNRLTIAGPIAKENLNKEISVPIKDEKGTVVTNAKFLFETAEIRNEIIVNGQKAQAVKGRTFLILNVKITNDYSKPIELSVRDFARLSVNGKDQEWAAADIHNDPVNVRPVATKVTRLGFPINDTDKDLTLRLGDISGDKQTVTLRIHK